jgi:hypothetical protein
VLLGIRGIPGLGLGVRDPQAGLAGPLQPDDEVHGGVLPTRQRLVEGDEDGPLGDPKLDLGVVGPQPPPEVVAHGLDDRSGSVLVFRIRSKGGMGPSVQHDSSVGVEALVPLMDGAVGGAVGEGARRERVPDAAEVLLQQLGSRRAARTRLLESGIVRRDLRADVV